jgi:hypothetical protein
MIFPQRGNLAAVEGKCWHHSQVWRSSEERTIRKDSLQPHAIAVSFHAVGAGLKRPAGIPRGKQARAALQDELY